MELIGIIDDFNNYMKKITYLEIDPESWQGETEQAYISEHRNAMEKSINSYTVRLKQVEDEIDNAIELLTQQLTQSQSDIIHLNASILSITTTISTLKEE